MYEDFVRERIAKLRTRKNVSAREMSLSIGQNVNYINRIENGKNLPSMQAFFYICEYLGITPREFFDEESSDPERLREVTGDLKRMDLKDLEHLSALVKSLVRRK